MPTVLGVSPASQGVATPKLALADAQSLLGEALADATEGWEKKVGLNCFEGHGGVYDTRMGEPGPLHELRRAWFGFCGLTADSWSSYLGLCLDTAEWSVYPRE